MDIKKLQNIDIKQVIEYARSLNIEQIREAVQTRPDLIIKVVLIGLTLFSSMRILGSYSGTARKLGTEIKTMQEKLDAIEESKRIQKEYDDFTANFPESILPDQLISTLSDFAARHNVQILSFNPTTQPVQQKDAFMELASVEIHVASERYEDLVLFIKDIEDAPYTLRVDQLSGQMGTKTTARQTRQGKTARPQEQKLIEAKIEIGSVKLKDAL